MITKALTNFSKINDAAISQRATAVLAGMTGNPNYPGATAQVTALHTAAEAYSTALSVAEHGSSS